MRTTFIETEEYGKVTINHNSDWSGEASIVWVEQQDGHPRQVKEVKIPGEILVKLGFDAAVNVVRDKIISVLEDI